MVARLLAETVGQAFVAADAAVRSYPVAQSFRGSALAVCVEALSCYALKEVPRDKEAWECVSVHRYLG